MSKHTPGPWEMSHTGGCYRHTIHVGTVTIAQTSCVRIDEHDENEANARLIAAAPDLLEALEEVHQWITEKIMSGSKEYMPKYNIVSSAIAKAKGGYV